jgi:hypothetical protein
MKIEIETLSSQNITIVYKNLDIQSVDGRQIKKILGKDILVSELPEIMVFIRPDIPLIIQLEKQRFRITLQGMQENVELLWDIATNCYYLLPNIELVAYGFNYDIRIISKEGDFIEHLNLAFINNLMQLGEQLGGESISITPRLKYQREKVLYDLILEPIDNSHLVSHFNAHYKYDGIEIKDGTLKESYTETTDYWNEFLPRLFK